MAQHVVPRPLREFKLRPVVRLDSVHPRACRSSSAGQLLASLARSSSLTWKTSGNSREYHVPTLPAYFSSPEGA
jgi:hypothetical protein